MNNEYTIKGDKLTGHTNAVRAARCYLESIGADIDHASFEAMEIKAGRAPQATIDDGFVVDSIDAVGRLCEIAHMNIIVKAGVCYAEEA